MDLIVNGDAFVLFLEATDALVDGVVLFGEAGFKQAFAEFGEFLFVFFPETFVDAL
jgi:hypothetical protein